MLKSNVGEILTIILIMSHSTEQYIHMHQLKNELESIYIYRLYPQHDASYQYNTQPYIVQQFLLLQYNTTTTITTTTTTTTTATTTTHCLTW